MSNFFDHLLCNLNNLCQNTINTQHNKIDNAIISTQTDYRPEQRLWKSCPCRRSMTDWVQSSAHSRQYAPHQQETFHRRAWCTALLLKHWHTQTPVERSKWTRTSWLSFHCEGWLGQSFCTDKCKLARTHLSLSADSERWDVIMSSI